ncbi:hypothetical protein [Streptomyces turgidiscabies]|uniref:hypothetical protein n=1 Tax=Streptomyces turgidiscabies TaxID=85558 RepID=UPI0038F7D3D9
MTFAPRTWVVGEVVSAALLNQEIRDQFNTMFAAWTSYTPTWTAATSNPALGNGTLVGRYIKWGRTVLFHVNLVMGSTTTYGSGAYSFDVPATSANAGATFVGTAQLAATLRWAGQTLIIPNASVLTVFLSTSNANPTLTPMTGTAPVTLASTNQLRITGTYETAA